MHNRLNDKMDIKLNIITVPVTHMHNLVTALCYEIYMHLKFTSMSRCTCCDKYMNMYMYICIRVVVEAGTSETKTEAETWVAETKTETEAI